MTKPEKDPTLHFIDCLAKDADAIDPVCCPKIRSLYAIILAITVSTAAAYFYGVRPDLYFVMDSPIFWLKVIFSAGTAITATTMAFLSGVPGFNKRLMWVPYGFFAGWFLVLAAQLFNDFQLLGMIAFNMTPSFGCIIGTASYAIPLLIVTYFFFRRYKPVYPTLTASFMAMGVFSFCASSWSFHFGDEVAFIPLLWHFGMVAVYTAIFSLLGRILFRW